MASPFVTLPLVLTALGFLLAGAAVVVMAVALLRPPRMTDGKAVWVLKRLSPGDLGLRFEEVSFEVRDERGRPMRVAGWWVPHPAAAGRCAVLIHGYADAKVGAIGWAPTWHALGFNLLAIDLRAHGESGGTYTTGGYFERHDVDAVLNQLRAQRPSDTRQLVLFGASLGAAVALATAAGRDDLAAVVLDSPFADYRHAALAHMDLLGAPGRPLGRLAVRLAQWIAGADFGAVRPVDLIRRVSCPLLVIIPEQDVFLAPSDARAISEALGPAGRIWRVPGATHLTPLLAGPDEYRSRLESFLAQSFHSPRVMRPAADPV